MSPCFAGEEDGDVVVELKVTFGLPAVVIKHSIAWKIASQFRPVKLNHGRFANSEWQFCEAVV